MNDDPDATFTPDTAPETTSSTQSTAPNTTTPPSPVRPEPTAAKPNKKPVKFLVGGIIAGAMVLLGGGAALGYTMWYQNPDKVVHDAIINSIQAKAVSLAGTMDFKSDNVNFGLTFDSKSGQEGSGEFNVAAKITLDDDGTERTLNVDGSGTIIDNTLYFKVGGVKELFEEFAEDGEVIPAFASGIIDKVDSRWISISPADYADMNQEVSSQQQCTTDLIKKIQSDDDMKGEIVDLYRDNQIVTIEDELGSKNVNGTGSLGYEINFDQEAASSFTRGLKDTSLGQELQKCNQDIDFDELFDEATEINETDGDDMSGKVELWVSRFGHNITEINAIVENTESGDTVQAVLQPTFNSTVDIEAPTESISLKELIEELQSAMMESYMNSLGDDFMIDPTFELPA